MSIHQLKFKNENIPNYYMNDNCEIYSCNSNKILSSFLNKEGRPVISLIMNDKKVMIRLDYLVISTLSNFTDDIIHIIHVDDDNTNCSLDNLLVIKKSEIIDKYKNLYNVDDLSEIKEEWRCHSKYNFLLISNFGNIKTNNNSAINILNNHGYNMINIKNDNFFIHRLVAELFVENPKPDKYFYVNHIDGNKSNNNFYNLEWCNISMNTEHAVLSGLNKSYTEEDVRKICQLLSDGLSHIKISIITGINRKYISDIYRGRRWGHISSQYTFNKKIPLSELYNEDAVIALLKSGYNIKKISEILKINNNNSFQSYCNRLKRKL